MWESVRMREREERKRERESLCRCESVRCKASIKETKLCAS